MSGDTSVRDAAGRGEGASGPARATTETFDRRVGEFVFAALSLALGIFVLVGAFAIRVPGAGTQVGPRVFPFLVSAILIGSAVMVLIELVRGTVVEEEGSEDIEVGAKTDWMTLLKLVVFVIAHLVLIDILGWVIAAAILFGGVAWSLGARRWWVALLIGLALGLVVQIVFGGLLGLSLPLGPVFGWLAPFIRSLGA
jgi:putative tricarboxylic transport membrane protein